MHGAGRRSASSRPSLAVSASVLPVAFGAAVAASSWRVGFALSALFPLAGWRLLRGMPG